MHRCYKIDQNDVKFHIIRSWNMDTNLYLRYNIYIEHGMTTQKKLYIGKFTATCVRQQAFYSKKPDTTPPTQLSKS